LPKLANDLEGQSKNQRFLPPGIGQPKGAVEMSRYELRPKKSEDVPEKAGKWGKASFEGGLVSRKSGGVSERPSRRSESKYQGGTFANRTAYPQKLEPLAERFKGNFNAAFARHPEWADLTPSNITALCDGRLDRADKPWDFDEVLEPFLLAIKIEKARAEMKPASKFVAPYIVEDLFTGKKFRRGTLEDGTVYEEEI
jgi:hypothetical protein